MARQTGHSPQKLLVDALIFTFIIHAVAMVGMAVFLLPGMPGGGVVEDAQRVAYIAGHPWLWRLGWLGWQVCAVSDLLLGAALLRTPWIPRAAAWTTIALTVAAVIPDQAGQALWVTHGVHLAQEAVRTGNLQPYLEFEARIFPWIAAWGATGYTLGGLGWTWCFAGSGVWNPWLTRLSVPLWLIFGVVSVGMLLPGEYRLPPVSVSAGNAAAFLLLEAWFVLVTEEVLLRERPEEAHGRYAPWRFPGEGPLDRIPEAIANSRFLRALGELLPPVAMHSDVTDVIYVNYLVDRVRLIPLVPEGLELQPLGPGGRYAMFTFLTYRHGHFGPQFMGPLRRLLPSPIQSNWRIYVHHPRTGTEGVYFVTTAIDHLLYALAARFLAEGLPMHLPAQSTLTRERDGHVILCLESGGGSAPDADARLIPDPDRTLPFPWTECFKDYAEFLAYCVPQDRAFSCQPWRCRVTRQEIHLGIPLDQCEPLRGEVISAAATAIVGDAYPLCFRVPSVSFEFRSVGVDPLP